jgi:hypothetical protein
MKMWVGSIDLRKIHWVLFKKIMSEVDTSK